MGQHKKSKTKRNGNGSLIRLFAVVALGLSACYQGPVGPSGIQGSQGNTGATGPSGSNGTAITIVQFCPGTPSYPSTFPEVGFCINNEIWAVYSANDGFLTEITPGAYSSNAVGSACNFTVSANCVVSQ